MMEKVMRKVSKETTFFSLVNLSSAFLNTMNLSAKSKLTRITTTTERILKVIISTTWFIYDQ